MPLSGSALGTRLRSSGGRLVRRLGLLPGGEPDGLGQDAELGDRELAQRVVVFFPEPPTNGYQLHQWLDPLRALDEQHGVVLITQDSRTAAQLRARTSLTVLCVARTATLEGLLDRGQTGLALYVSHHPRNFQLLRSARLAHVYLGHGESDKAVSASNQLKAYDRAFVAGPAAVDRVRRELMWFDAERLVQVGRPQVPGSVPAGPSTAAPGRPPTVLYAPTWEGAQPAMAYGSVVSHGEALVGSLLAAGLRVVYRPHPRTGANRREAAVADASVRSLLTGPPAVATGSAVVTDVPLAAAFAEADLLVTDVSSVATEWLPTGRPLVVTTPAEVSAAVGPSPLLDLVPRLPAAAAATAGELARSLLAEDPVRPARLALVDHYLGGADQAGATARFLAACTSLLAERDVLQARLPGAAP